MAEAEQKVTGYRELSREEIDLVNEGKRLAQECGEFIERLEAMESLDQRCVSLGKTNLQQGFMWATRGITRPTTF